MIVACQWKRSSPTGPALQFAGGSRPRSCVENGARYDGARASGVWEPRRSRGRGQVPAHVSAVVQGRGDGVPGHRGLFTKVAAGMVFRAFVPMKASGRENSMPFSCMSSAKAAAALAGAPACLTPRLRPGRPIRATPFLPQHARRPPIFLRWHEHLQLFINSFERHALSRRGFPLSGAFIPYAGRPPLAS